jgi:hypothetical protein
MATQSPSRLDSWLPALLLFTGSAVFLGTGRLHPHINASLGEVGSDDFFRRFAAEMLRTPNWESMHLGILLGPVLWALAAGGVARLLPTRATSLGDVGRNALLLAAALWSVAFVLDGFVGPGLAATIATAGVDGDAVAIRAFRASQLTMARLGMLSVVLMGAAMFTFAAGLLVGSRLRSWRTAVGALGIIAGAWPMIAAMRGDFYPGPFTTSYWTLMALSFGLWFLLLGTVLPGMREREYNSERGQTITRDGGDAFSTRYIADPQP